MSRAEHVIAMRLKGTERQQDAIEAAVGIFTDEVVNDGIAPVFSAVADRLEKRAEAAEGWDGYAKLLREVLAKGSSDEKAFIIEAVSRYVRRVVRNPLFHTYRNRAEIIDLFADIKAAQDRRPS